MPETATSSTNKAVSFGRKTEREMPDNRLNADGKPVEGSSITAPKNGKSVKRAVRKTAKRAMKRGMISEKAAKRHLGDY